MPGVFISYARHDLSAEQQIEHALYGRDIAENHPAMTMPAGDFHLTIVQSDTKPAKTLVERWQTWVALFVGVLTITTLAADLPGKIRKIFAPDESTIQVMQQPLSGVIWDQGHEPLTAAGAVLPEFNWQLPTVPASSMPTI
jgi:hypothetical protein